jgi:hypothetical protein
MKKDSINYGQKHFVRYWRLNFHKKVISKVEKVDKKNILNARENSSK